MMLRFRGQRADHDHANPAFYARVTSICAVAAVLLGVPGIGSVFSLPATHAGSAVARCLGGVAVRALVKSTRLDRLVADFQGRESACR